MYVEIDFARPESIDQVVADCTSDQEGMRMRLRYEASPSSWQTIAESAEVRDVPPQDGMRGAAVQEVERSGVHWLLVHDQERGSDDFYRYQQLWGIRLAATSGPYKLYQLR